MSVTPTSKSAATAGRDEATTRASWQPTRWGLVATSLLAGAALTVWVAVAVFTASRGLDLSDESFYLLSYRWWSVDDRAFSGVQYVYGPVFQALGYDIAALRIFRVATVVLANAGFAAAFMRWLRTRRPHAPVTRLWDLAGVLLITTVGGLAFSWLPKAPGYNDVAALGALLCAAIVLELARGARRGHLPGWWVGVVAALVAFAMVLTKWASAMLTLTGLFVVAVIVLVPLGWRAIVRFVVPFALAVALSAGLFHVLIAPLDRVVGQMIETNRLIARATNSPRSLLVMYLESTYKMVRRLGRLWLPLAVVFTLVPFLRGRLGQLAGLLALLGGVVWVGNTVVGGDLYWGGTIHLASYLLVVTAGIVLAAILLVSSWLARLVVQVWRARTDKTTPSVPSGHPSWASLLSDLAIVGMLILLPVLQAAGTGNPILYLALSCYGAWMALVVWVWTGLTPARDGWATWTSAAVAAALMVTSSCATAVTGMWYAPYRTSPAAVSTVPVSGVRALESLTFDQVSADDIAAYAAALRPWTAQPGRRVMAFDELAGLVLVVEGRSVGEAWYSTLDAERTAAGIEATCRESGPLTQDKPILLFKRPRSASDDRALRACGLSVEQDYRQLSGVPPRLGIVVFVPKDTP